jgi:hypothetical protein
MPELGRKTKRSDSSFAASSITQIEDLSPNMISFFESTKVPCSFLNNTGDIQGINKQHYASGKAINGFSEKNKDLFKSYIDLGFKDSAKRQAYLKQIKENVLGRLNSKIDLSRYKSTYEKLTMEQYLGIFRENSDEIHFAEGSGFGRIEFKDGTDDYTVFYNLGDR